MAGKLTPPFETLSPWSNSNSTGYRAVEREKWIVVGR
jgi:hypothetical protein